MDPSIGHRQTQKEFEVWKKGKNVPIPYHGYAHTPQILKEEKGFNFMAKR